MEFAKVDYKQVATELDTDIKKGLTSEEVLKRLKVYGPNKIKEKEVPTWKKFVKRFANSISILIEIAAILSAVLGKWADFSIILSLLFINVTIDFLQEYRSGSIINELKKKLKISVKVLRNGKVIEIPIENLVPGDIVVLHIGDIVPADVKLFGEGYLLVDQSSLTGESLPVVKQENDIVYSGTLIKQGVLYGIVIKTGENTKFGKNVQLIKKAEINQTGHLHKMIIKITDYLILLTTILVITLFIVSLFRGGNILEFIRFALVLFVASIPVALPAVLSVTMVVGALNLAKLKSVVKHLSAIQELASVDVLCVDKTGTLTKNKLKVYSPLSYGEFSKKDVILYGILASKIEEKDPLELAIYSAASNFKITKGELKKYEQISLTPFDPKSKKSTAIVKLNKKKFRVAKGAPQVILSMCNPEYVLKQKIESDVENLAKKGFRTLGIALNRGKKWEFVGLIPLYDPPRDDAAKTIKSIEDMGVKVKMVTGDNKAIAKEIAKILGIGNKIYTFEDLFYDNKKEFMILAKLLSEEIYKKLRKNVSDKQAELFADEIVDEIMKEFKHVRLQSGTTEKHKEEIIKVIESADGFAEVYPEDKFTIVDALQSKGHIVGMTGDGVNDAPALKKADCGIAVSGATDVARTASDIVLLLPGIKVIADAISESRKIFKRMNSYVIYRITETIRILFFMTLAILVFNFYPITPLMLVILALLNDIPILMIAYDNASVSKIVEKWNVPSIILITTVLGLTGLVSTFLLYYIAVAMWKLPLNMISTLIFLKLAVAGHMTLYVARHTKAFWDHPLPSWKLFTALEGTQFIATLIAVYGIFVTPIGWKLALIVWGYAFVWFLFLDRIKIITYKVIEKHKSLEKSFIRKL